MVTYFWAGTHNETSLYSSGSGTQVWTQNMWLNVVPNQSASGTHPLRINGVVSTYQTSGYMQIEGPWGTLVGGGSLVINNHPSATVITVRAVNTGGTMYVGRNVSHPGSTASSWGPTYPGSLTGAVNWIGLPGRPALTISPGPNADQVRVGISAPADNGGSGITGYVVQYANNPGFSGLTQVAVTNNQVLTMPTTGQTWYFRLSAFNAMTPLVGLGSAYSATRSFVMASPGSSYPVGVLVRSEGLVTLPDGSVFVSDTGADRIYHMSPNGEVLRQWGETGTANGQLDKPRGIYYHSNRDSVFVADSGNNRIQEFTRDGVFVQTFGTAGSGTSNLSNPADLSFVPRGLDGYLVIADQGNNRVVGWYLSGTPAPAAAFNFGNTGAHDHTYSPRGIQVTADESTIAVVQDSDSSVRRTSYWTIVRDGLNIPTSVSYQGYTITPGATSVTYSDSIGSLIVASSTLSTARFVDHTDPSYVGRSVSVSPAPLYIASGSAGLYYTALDNDYGKDQVFLIALSRSTLSGVIRQIISLAMPDVVVDYQATEHYDLVLPAWRGDVWDHLKQLCSVYGVEIADVSGVITIRDIGTRVQDITNLVRGSVTLTSTNASTGRLISFNVLDATSGFGVVYDSGSTVHQVGRSQTITTRVTTSNYPVHLNQPVCSNTFPLGPDEYCVLDREGVIVNPADWNDARGSVSATLVDGEPGAIDLQLIGPNRAISGTATPYSFALPGTERHGSITITGSGVFTEPNVREYTTGADPTKTIRDATRTVNNFAFQDINAVYRNASWIVGDATGPVVTLSCTVPTNTLNGFGLVAGSLIKFRENTYRITTARMGNVSTAINAVRHMTIGDLEDATEGMTIGDVEDLWEDRKIRDFVTRPLLGLTA